MWPLNDPLILMEKLRIRMTKCSITRMSRSWLAVWWDPLVRTSVGSQRRNPTTSNVFLTRVPAPAPRVPTRQLSQIQKYKNTEVQKYKYTNIQEQIHPSPARPLTCQRLEKGNPVSMKLEIQKVFICISENHLLVSRPPLVSLPKFCPTKSWVPAPAPKVPSSLPAAIVHRCELALLPLMAVLFRKQ